MKKTLNHVGILTTLSAFLRWILPLQTSGRGTFAKSAEGVLHSHFLGTAAGSWSYVGQEWMLTAALNAMILGLLLAVLYIGEGA